MTESAKQYPMSTWARAYVEKYGLSVLPLRPKTKRPYADNWAKNPDAWLTDAQAAHAHYTSSPADNIGVVLGHPGGLCSLDIDDEESARLIFAEFGVDLDDLIANNPTIVGASGGFRIEFRVPEGANLTTHALAWPTQDDPKKRFTVFEFRGAGGQDVFPPSIHPDTLRPYTWRTSPKDKPFQDLPEDLLYAWQGWDEGFKRLCLEVCPWAPELTYTVPPANNGPVGDGTDTKSVIVRFNAAHSVAEMLERFGYQQRGKLFLYPGSKTKIPGVRILDGNRAWSHHGSDPMNGTERGGKPINPFDLFCFYDHGDNVPRAVRAAAQVLGIAHKTKAEKAAGRSSAPTAPTLRDGEHLDEETGEIAPAPAAPVAVKSTVTRAEPAAPAFADPRLQYMKFRPLGYNSGTYYYMASGTQQITALTASQHSKANLIQLARLAEWDKHFKPGGAKSVDWDDAMDTLMRECEYRGVFDVSMLRGRGVWYDDGRIMVHLGDRVLVDGSANLPGRVDSRYIYEAKIPMRASVDDPLTATEAKRYADLIAMAAWEKPLSASLCAGWAVVAHIGGVLNWRPHIWIIGRRGSGKTHVMANMVRPVMGDNVLHVQGHTSEAGIRQDLGVDSLPVLFDEAEGEDAKANDRLQSVLALVRQSSSETGGKMLKGTTAGKSMQFQIRSCFAFSSITANLMQQSDKSRVTILELNQDYSRHEFQAIVDAQIALLTDDYVQRFYARALAMAPTIRKNAIAFAGAAATALGEQRAGDQLGALLAGAYSLESDDELTAEQARAWVESRDWSEQRDEARGQSDEQACWSYLLQQRLAVQTDHGREDLPVGVLLDIATGKSNRGTGVDRQRAEEILMRTGFKVMPDETTVAVSNGAVDIKKMLEGKPWGADWGRVLKRLPGAAPSSGMVYFGFKGSEKRATLVPITDAEE
jgi:putative DNA primase/helicase